LPEDSSIFCDPTNREIAANAPEGNGSGARRAERAGPELTGFAVLALAAIGRLTVDYNGKSRTEAAQATTPVGGANTGTPQPVGLIRRNSTSRSIPRHPRCPDLIKYRDWAREQFDETNEVAMTSRRFVLYHPRVPAPPLNGPTMREVIQPP
jgi:hypothetical protein